MGITTVAVYSDADQESLFVKQADEAYSLGGSKPQDSYNHIKKMVKTAKMAKCEAIHPGYGFLSENPLFAKRCEEEGLIFIGPPAACMELMGRKIEARRTMEDVGLPVIPGISFPLYDVEEAVQYAEKVGYPVMLKASAGGGGIGMESIGDEQELRSKFAGHLNRAQLLFGHSEMFIEKLLIDPRHIEIQVLADSYGNTVHLWERECSIQRRNQKIVEEAPSPFLTEAKRHEMGMAAVAAAKAIGYINAGTFEFMVDEEGNYYFLEMNTRIQVEHPVTEEITNLDLVEEQIRVAAGEKLRFLQKDIPLIGHALEVRLYAEDPISFFPSPGRITELNIPNGENIRHELGVEQNVKITPFYDGMFAKLIVSGINREVCMKRMQWALSHYTVKGIKTNIPMLQQIISHEQFQKGNTTTSFVEKYYLTL